MESSLGVAGGTLTRNVTFTSFPVSANVFCVHEGVKERGNNPKIINLLILFTF